MTQTASIQPKSDSFADHQRWGGTYLVVADESEEFPVALKYAARMAKNNKCHVGIIYVMENQDFQHWGNVEARMRDEQRKEAEKLINSACYSLNEMEAGMPSIYIEEGGRIDALIQAIENDSNISMLILCGGTHGSGPGPLVSHFTGKGLPKLRVPVMVVPDTIHL